MPVQKSSESDTKGRKIIVILSYIKFNLNIFYHYTTM